MADIRINALPTTATDFASDDYIAIDGTTNGTRKLNAKTANLTFSDVTLGTSGPSVKSTLSARSPRQGLVFDGTAGATVSVPAFGTSDFSVAAIVNTDLSVNIEGIVGANASSGFGLFVFNDGTLAVQYTGISTVGGSTSKITANKNTIVAYTRSGTTGTFYINGVSAGTITDSTNYTTAIGLVGNVAGLNIFKGTVAPLIYNRALSASEVVALYEAGAPAGSDYNSASNTSLITGDNSTFASDTGYWTKSSATIGSGVCTISAGGFIYKSSFYSGIGKRYRLVVTINSIVSGNLRVNTGNDSIDIPGATAPGTYTFEYAVVSPGTAPLALATTTGQIVIDNVLVYPLGLLLAPDAAQAGGGLTWYDTSGNAANITLPASGVSWNVPSSRYLGGNWTTSGTLTISGGQAVNIGSNANYNLWKDATPTKAGRVILNNAVSNGLSVGLYDGSSWVDTLHIHPTNNNVLIGTTTDTGEKLQVNGTGYFAGALLQLGNGSNDALYRVSASNGKSSDFGDDTTGGFVRANNSQSLRFITAGNIVLTLDSSANATFAGTVTASKAGTAFYSIESTVNGAISEVIVKGKNSTGTAREARLGLNKYADDVFSIYDGTTERFRLGLTNGDATFSGTIAIGQYTTAGAPAYAKGKLYFDVTLNKLRVGGATGWETITSV